MLGSGTNLQNFFGFDDSLEVHHPFIFKNALKRTPIPHIEVPLDSEKGAHAFIDESGQAGNPVPKAGIGTRLHAFGKTSQSENKNMITAQAQAGIFEKESKGKKIRRKKRERK